MRSCSERDMNSSPFVYELSDILTKDMEDIDKILGAVENEIQISQLLFMSLYSH